MSRPSEARAVERISAFQSEMREIAQTYADDREAQQQAIIEASKRHDVHPLRPCAPALARGMAVKAPALWSPLNQTLPDRLAGIVVVEA
jgi:hypothetical protein